MFGIVSKLILFAVLSIINRLLTQTWDLILCQMPVCPHLQASSSPSACLLTLAGRLKSICLSAHTCRQAQIHLPVCPHLQASSSPPACLPTPTGKLKSICLSAHTCRQAQIQLPVCPHLQASSSPSACLPTPTGKLKSICLSAHTCRQAQIQLPVCPHLQASSNSPSKAAAASVQHTQHGARLSVFFVKETDKCTSICDHKRVRSNELGWPELYIYTVYDGISGDLPAKNTVYTPYVIYIHRIYMVLANHSDESQVREGK